MTKKSRSQIKRPSVVRDGIRPNFSKEVEKGIESDDPNALIRHLREYADVVATTLCLDSTAGDHLTKDDIKHLYFDKVCTPLLRRQMVRRASNKKAESSGPLVKAANKYFDRFCEELEVLPRKYEITIGCPSLEDIQKDITQLADFSISRKQRKRKNKRIPTDASSPIGAFYSCGAYFTAHVEGWMGEVGSGSALRKAIVNFKQIAGLGLAVGLFAHSHMSLVRPTVKIRGKGLEYILFLGDAFENLVKSLSWPEESMGGVKEKIKMIESVISADNELVKSVLSASAWYCDAISEINETNGFIYACFGLESLLRCSYAGDLRANENASRERDSAVRQQLRDRALCLLGQSIQERRQISKDIDAIYRLRSDIVHGERVRMDPHEHQIGEIAAELLKRLISHEAKISIN